MPIFHDGNGLIKNTKTVDARVCAPVTGEPLAGSSLRLSTRYVNLAGHSPHRGTSTLAVQGVGGVHYETFAVPTGRSRKFSRHPESRKPDTWPGFDLVVDGVSAWACHQRPPGAWSGRARNDGHAPARRLCSGHSSNGDASMRDLAHGLAGHRCALLVLVVWQVVALPIKLGSIWCAPGASIGRLQLQPQPAACPGLQTSEAGRPCA